MARCQRAKVCRRPQRKNHVRRPAAQKVSANRNRTRGTAAILEIGVSESISRNDGCRSRDYRSQRQSWPFRYRFGCATREIRVRAKEVKTSQRCQLIRSSRGRPRDAQAVVQRRPRHDVGCIDAAERRQENVSKRSVYALRFRRRGGWSSD